MAQTLKSLGAHFRLDYDDEDYPVDIALEGQKIAIEVRSEKICIFVLQLSLADLDLDQHLPKDDVLECSVVSSCKSPPNFT